jgi:hypothetical protein
VTAASPSDEQRDTLVRALGGRRGVLDTGLPGIVFVTVFTVTSLSPALWAAVGVGGLLTVARLARRETLQHALAGFVGVAVAAYIAHRTGEARNFFLPGLFINAGYAAAYLLSIAFRWPVIGIVLGPLLGEGTAWRRDPPRLRAYAQATWVWVGMFLLRIAVQLPLYLAGWVVALGAARLAMGWPLFLGGAWVCYLILRRVPMATRSDAPGA